MNDDRRPFQMFVIRAHRRRVVWHFLEYIAIGLLIQSALLMLVLPLAWWQGRSVDEVPVIMLGLTVIAAIVLAISSRPKPQDTARRIDQQLNAHDLITSALLTTREHDFAGALYAMADARLDNVAISSLVLRRFAPRTFIGAGLATTCTIIVTMMVSSVGVERAAVARSQPNPVDQWINERRDTDRAVALALPNDGSSRPAQPDPSSARPGLSNSSPNESGRTSDRRSDVDIDSNNASRGSGAARSESAIAQPPDRLPANAPNSATGTLSSGGDGMAANAAANGAHGGEVVTSAQRDVPIAPWQSTDWAQDRAAALRAVQNGSVPDSYRALVQDYFDRQ